VNRSRRLLPLLVPTLLVGLLLSEPVAAADPSGGPTAAATPSPQRTDNADASAGDSPGAEPSPTTSPTPSTSPGTSPSPVSEDSATPASSEASSEASTETPTGTPTAAASPSSTPNEAPVAQDDTASVTAGQSVTVEVLANDTDDGQGRPTDPQHLAVTGTSDDPRLSHDDSTITFRAGNNDSGTVRVEYTVSDGSLTDVGQVTIEVAPMPRSVSIAMASRVVALRRYPVHGRVDPTVLGSPVVRVQRRKGDRWVLVGKDRADAAGRYHVPFRTNRPVRFVFRAVATWPDGKVRRSSWLRRRVDAVAAPHVSGPLSRSQVPFSWRSGCPVPPRDLRRISINRINYRHRVTRGRLVVHESAVRAVRSVFVAAINKRFPVKLMRPSDFYYDHGRRTPSESDVAAMRAGNTSAFNCRPVTGNPYRLSQHSYGNAIDINTIQNPYVTGSRVYPGFAGRYLDRSPYRKGMILSPGVVASRMSHHGWLWGARWSNPDYQHFSANGG
jgi:hypothetical protein